MKNIQSLIILSGLISAALISSCGEDRSGEYYSLIGPKKWIYETMQQNYLYYQDMPSEDNLDFFKKPSDFLASVVSDKDKKSGVTYSHIDSIFVKSKSNSNIPTFGFEGAMIRANDGSNAIKVLYTQENSPASEVGLKRGDLIIAANGKKIGSNDFFYITNPMEAYTFTLGKLNETDFDTIPTPITMPAPRIVENKNILKYNILETGTKRAAYICYNEFGNEKDVEEIKNLFLNLAGQNVNDIILDLRYNPGGYVSTSQILSTNLAPQEAMGNDFLKMIHNDKINKTDVLKFDINNLANGSVIQYGNLYVITSQNTASAAEIVINCLKPYLGERLIQVGTSTFGKNVAQQLYTDEVNAPMLEFWLTNSLLSNSMDFSDYSNGLKPDFNIEENMNGELGELGTEKDSLMLPILYHIQNGNFPATDENHDNSNGNETLSKKINNSQIFRSSIDFKPKSAIIK